MKYAHVFNPVKIGNVTVKNRLVMSPVTMNYATSEGYATDKLIRYYRERAKGGVGLIIVEGTFFTPEGKGYVNQLGIASQEHATAMKRLTDAVHDLNNETKIFLQIHHAGRRVSSKISGHQPVAPSAIPAYEGGEVPHALTVSEIKALIKAHVQAAVWARDAGFDGVDIHCAHGYLIPSFFSPLSNARDDEYGGDFDGRTRFLVETIRGIKDELGKDFPLTIKISGDEFIEGGLTIDDMVEVARCAQEAGIDGLNVSAGSVGGEKIKDFDNLHKVLRTMPMMTGNGCLTPLAAVMKKNLNIPVITVGRINEVALAEVILAQGKADLVAMGRALLADPYLPQKAMEGKESTIRPCIGCNEGCYKRIFQQLDIRCAVNPTVGEEDNILCIKVESPRKVLVVGGGPGGMSAALAAHEKGHKVTLIEKETKLGGQLNLASVPPGRHDIDRINKFLVESLYENGIEVITDKEVTRSLAAEMKPDVMILATGAIPRSLSIPGLKDDQTISAWDVLCTDSFNRAGTFLVVGGGLVGCEVADYLAECGNKVILVEVLPQLAMDGDGDTQAYFMMRFEKNGVQTYTKAKIEEIEESTAAITCCDQEIHIPFDNVVMAVGSTPDERLYKELASDNYELIKVGDCMKPRRILDAVYEGFKAGREV